jgi:hypothetical protein
MSWLYPTLAGLYKDWLPLDVQDSFVESFSPRGYYTFLLKPGLRLITVNPNACLAYNL